MSNIYNAQKVKIFHLIRLTVYIYIYIYIPTYQSVRNQHTIVIIFFLIKVAVNAINFSLISENIIKRGVVYTNRSHWSGISYRIPVLGNNAIAGYYIENY